MEIFDISNLQNLWTDLPEVYDFGLQRYIYGLQNLSFWQIFNSFIQVLEEILNITIPYNSIQLFSSQPNYVCFRTDTVNTSLVESDLSMNISVNVLICSLVESDLSMNISVNVMICMQENILC